MQPKPRNMIRQILIYTAVLFLVACGNAQTEGNENTTSEATQTAQIAEDVDAAAFAKLIEEKSNAQLLDVRTPEEVAQGIIPNAGHIDFYSDDFDAQLSQLDPNRPVLVYCAAGGRSGKAMNAMKKLGFQEVYNLDGGYRGWSEAGKPTTPPSE